MTATITIDKPLDEGVRALLRSMLEKGTVRAVLTLRRLEDGGGVAHCLVTDPAALAEAVNEFLANDRRRQAMGQAARSRAQAEFSLPVMVARVLAVYEEVLQQRD